jgi:sodium-dependent dicarboxylate transporter 2/3/5
MSNTALSNISAPILARLAVSLKQNPILFMLPATIACSFAFSTPIGIS